MTREDHLLLRRLAVTVTGLALVLMALGLAAFQGGAMYLACSQGGLPRGQALAAAAGAGFVGFLACWAGVDHFLARMRAWLDPGPEDDGE